MKRTVWMMAAVGIVLLGFAACGSAAPESPDENTLFAANGPALTVVEKQPDQYTTDPEDKTVPPEQSPDLLTMNSQEEEGFALFYPLLSETQFRCLMDEDGVDFIPNRLASCEEGGLAYYSTAAGDLVYCTADFSTVKAVLCQQRVGLIIDARWLDADHLLFLQGNENEQAVYLFRPAEDMVELLYQSPEGRQILGIELDENGQPAAGADVEFKIYNYAEFYSVANKKADAEGKAFLSAGKGDMLVWATKDGKFGYSKVSFGKDNNVTITLDKKPGDIETVTLDVIPPVDGSIAACVTDEQKEANAKRLHEEDVIRNKYVGTFYTEEKAEALAKELGIDPLKTADFMIGSRGNWREIEKFLRDVPADKRPMAMDLLNVISAKDLRDTPASVLADHLNNAQAVQSSLFTEYILNPRVANEFLTPYRKFFAANVDSALVKKAKADPQLIVDWVKENISINDSLNPQRIPIMPMGVWKSRVADKGSRDIFFVAVCRSIGIPARIEPVAGKVQYAKGLNWVDVDFEAAEQTVAKQGKVVASYQPIKALQDPKYYSHFTIAKVLPTGKLQTLNFESGDVDMGGGDTWSALLKKPLSMDEGHYMLVTGTRMANGSVLAEMSFFNVEPGKTSDIKLEMRESQDDVQVIGNFNSENKFKRADNGEETSLLATTGRGYYVVAVLGARQEPTNHAMRDIAAVKKDLEEWGRGMVLLFPDEKGFQNFDPKEFGELPTTITYGIDIDKTIQKEIAAAMKLQNANTLPIFIIADTFNRVVFVSQGYTIGLGDQLMKVIHKL